MKFNIGDRVSLNKEALSLSYLVGRQSYTNMYEGKLGKIVGCTSDGLKMAIEFDDLVFTNFADHKSSHDNGCHGKGRLHYSWYIPGSMLTLVQNPKVKLLL
jgi:hypothetical protein